ncbi:hypothetical protein ITX54_05355 [Rouxiella silvae]|uniref:Lipoprotein n=1 Tax=Rouxiella silvae TaxID=1646373 RepID=A0AA40X0W5_9GAMM|nr:hypothetical protein [Rouxiella silvae]MBF6636092.1 hypothetical protein [Rouxiella silvae]
MVYLKNRLLFTVTVLLMTSGCQLQKKVDDETIAPVEAGQGSETTRECRYFQQMTGAPMAPIAYKALQDACYKSKKVKN